MEGVAKHVAKNESYKQFKVSYMFKQSCFRYALVMMNTTRDDPLSLLLPNIGIMPFIVCSYINTYL